MVDNRHRIGNEFGLAGIAPFWDMACVRNHIIFILLLMTDSPFFVCVQLDFNRMLFAGSGVDEYASYAERKYRANTLYLAQLMDPELRLLGVSEESLPFVKMECGSIAREVKEFIRVDENKVLMRCRVVVHVGWLIFCALK